MVDIFIFTFNLVAPVFLLVFIGYFLRRQKILTDSFSELASKFVYTVSLPVLVFVQLAQAKLVDIFDLPLLVMGAAGTLVFFGIGWGIGWVFIEDRPTRGSFIQGCFRSNYGIVGMAFAASLLGHGPGLSKASLLLATIIPLNNILAVIALSVHGPHDKELTLKDLLWEIVKNPMEIAAVLGIGFSLSGFSLPVVVLKTGEELSCLALPLALLAIGGTVKTKLLKKERFFAWTAAIIKVLIQPVILVGFAIWIG